MKQARQEVVATIKRMKHVEVAQDHDIATVQFENREMECSEHTCGAALGEDEPLCLGGVQMAESIRRRRKRAGSIISKRQREWRRAEVRRS